MLCVCSGTRRLDKWELAGCRLFRYAWGTNDAMQACLAGQYCTDPCNIQSSGSCASCVPVNPVNTIKACASVRYLLLWTSAATVDVRSPAPQMASAPHSKLHSGVYLREVTPRGASLTWTAQ